MGRALVTGAAGFIGSHVVRCLADAGTEVFAVVRPGSSTERLEDVKHRITVLRADLEDSSERERVVRIAAPEIAFHFAWIGLGVRYLESAADNQRSLEMSLGLIDALSKVKCRRIVLAGSCLENLSPAPDWPYISAKRTLHQTMSEISGDGFSWVCAHIFNVYGPWEDKARVTPQVIRSLQNNLEIAVTDGTQEREYMHVLDVASALCFLGTSALEGAVDVCSGRTITLGDVFEIIGQLTGGGELIRRGERASSAYDRLSIRGNPTLLRSTEWTERFSLESGLRHTVQWWREPAH